MANRIYPRTKIDEHEHLIQPLRVHSLLSDFELEDVWRVPVNLASTHSLQLFMDQLAKTNAKLVNRGMTGLLFRIRFFMGRLLKWDEKLLQDHLIPGSIRFRYAQQENLAYDDLPHPGSGSFIPVYKLENEFLSEIENSTVQGALHLSRVLRTGYVDYSHGGICEAQRLAWQIVHAAHHTISIMDCLSGSHECSEKALGSVSQGNSPGGFERKQSYIMWFPGLTSLCRSFC